MDERLLEMFLSNMEELIDCLEVGEPVPDYILDELLFEVANTRAQLERKWAWEEDNELELLWRDIEDAAENTTKW